MPSPSELHFEGPGPSRNRRWVLIGFVVLVILLLAMFARATLPSARNEFVGKWRNPAKSDYAYELRSDGTFTALLLEAQVGTDTFTRARCEGRWKANPDKLFLTYTKVEVPKSRDGLVEKRALQQVGLTDRVEIQWINKEQWQLSWDPSRTFKRSAR